MKTVIINNVDEMRQYYNSATNTYDFQENGQPLSILLMNDFITKASIKAKNITAKDINCNSIIAYNIKALDIIAKDTIDCNYIMADNITSYKINASNILVSYLTSIETYATGVIIADGYIKSYNLKAKSIIANKLYINDIRVYDINGYCMKHILG